MTESPKAKNTTERPMHLSQPQRDEGLKFDRPVGRAVSDLAHATREQMDQRVHELRESLSTTNTPGQRKSRGDERTR